MKKLLLNLFLFIVLYSCKSNEDSTSLQKNDSVKSGTAYTTDSFNLLSASEFVYEPITLPYTNTIEHFFSTNTSKDTFKITLEGSSVLEGDVVFEIINNEGKTIFSEKFRSLDFIEYYKEQTADTLEWEKYIIEKANSFFNESSFKTSAISIGAEFDETYSCCDKIEWEEIQSNQTSIGFEYNIGGGSTTRIAYSKKQKKAICYYASES